MIVVAIIGILASIALPAYQTYVAKAKITSYYATTVALKTAVFEYYVNEGEMPHHDLINESTDSRFDGFKALLRDGDETYGWYLRQNATRGSYRINLKKINGNVNEKYIRVLYEDANDSLEVRCVRDATLDIKYVPKQCIEPEY